MSLYHMGNGANPATFLIAPMLGGHPEQLFPRFRDCFIQQREWTVREDGFPQITIKEGSESEGIYIYTRVGGGNRESYEAEIEELQRHPDFIRDFDDDFDCTYATFVFKVPEKWKKDFELIQKRDLAGTSKEYQKMILETFPKIADKLAELFTEN